MVPQKGTDINGLVTQLNVNKSRTPDLLHMQLIIPNGLKTKMEREIRFKYRRLHVYFINGENLRKNRQRNIIDNIKTKNIQCQKLSFEQIQEKRSVLEKLFSIQISVK